ncbi:MarR family winged helix-turn-helix transcriptional regulator [Leucobacter allii]|uniref:MarR family winged helix-turn-helix transcriptional regulator n=1 Tax=Leucobacter allii TaxID=2932247 RepID=A0ABY4FMI9_9MICO|nr:MarR family winged helix-turn-helix transcriptional regulator [Leucobacter allii]UOQ57484.1 MarR family winged helix-turn-helix transcriptional regulator [Leucobacter allii]
MPRTPAPSPDAAWAGSDLGNDLSFLLARANAVALAAGNAALRGLGLKARSYSVLSIAAEGLRPTQRELAEYLRLDPSQIVALVDDLEGRGLVERRADARDRRSKAVVATAEGKRLCAAARAEVLAAEERPYAGLDAEERARLAELLKRVAFAD